MSLNKSFGQVSYFADNIGSATTSAWTKDKDVSIDTLAAKYRQVMVAGTTTSDLFEAMITDITELQDEADTAELLALDGKIIKTTEQGSLHKYYRVVLGKDTSASGTATKLVTDTAMANTYAIMRSSTYNDSTNN